MGQGLQGAWAQRSGNSSHGEMSFLLHIGEGFGDGVLEGLWGFSASLEMRGAGSGWSPLFRNDVIAEVQC